MGSDDAAAERHTEEMAWRFEGRSVTAPFDVAGEGADAVLLPALSSISTRAEMAPLAARLASRFRCLSPDWPGFGDGPRARIPLSPAMLRAFLADFIAAEVRPHALGVAAGHAAPYLVEAARRDPGRFDRLALVAPTWRGPLPTVMGGQRRPAFRRIRRLVETPLVGPLLYRLNVSRPVVARMMRAHVYADSARVTKATLAGKVGVTRRPGARFATAAFVTGGLDPVESREAFLDLFAPGLPPVLMIAPQGAPARSKAEMEALAATGRVAVAEVPGALAAHEESPDAVADAILAFVDRG